jgi:hypothetical protein
VRRVAVQEGVQRTTAVEVRVRGLDRRSVLAAALLLAVDRGGTVA